jgi:DNA-directed RNA polymerase subunit M/transcription elongation factor TFIIS
MQLFAMGSIFKASCPCGFRSDSLFLGGGFKNFETYCGAPALCTSCGSLTVINYLEENPRCRNCGGPVRFYNNSQLQSRKPSSKQMVEEVFSWKYKSGIFTLPNTEYLCPKCGKMTMRFEHQGMWD